ncbi:MAG: DOPA 4,5-dioxygenase family protein [Pseudomonadota bacterium]|nr:DOPA 4,5-dioxygenase family protein [Pseudomonadota bacterium]
MLGNTVFRSHQGIESYHVHLYYNGNTKQYASHIRREIERQFGQKVQIGRWRDLAPQGPHPVSHFQVAFPWELFAEIVPFLALNRKELNILLHPNTGNGYEDHTKNVMWIGPSIPLDKAWLENHKN